MNLRMYILVKDTVPIGVAMTSVAHASLGTYLRYKDDPVMQQWVQGKFHKVVCKVNDKEFENAKKVEDHLIFTESRLDNQEICIAFKPREEYPKIFKFYQLYK